MEPKNPIKLAKWQILLPMLIGITLAGGIFLGQKMNNSGPKFVVQTDTEQDIVRHLGYGRMEELIRYIEAKYVDNVEGEELVEGAIDHLLSQLDPHSMYIPKKEVQHLKEEMQGNFVGIGIEFMVFEDTIVVISPIKNGPSEAAGIQAGDKIVQIENESAILDSLETQDVIDALRGIEGTVVSLGVLRKNQAEIIPFSIARATIPTYSVDAAYMLNDSTGYIKVNRFSAKTYKEFMTALEPMVEQDGMKDLIIDLRQNPGGYLQESTKILSQLFKEKGKLLVYTEGKNTRKTEYHTSGRNFFEIRNIVVLIDEGSASASEIIAGALQDWDRAILIGRRSFGKGLVQEQYKMSDGSELRITVARYYTPSGRSIQKNYEDSDAYDRDFVNRYHSGELSDSSKFVQMDTTEYKTAGGRIVYGGGGISPDVFIPIDTLIFNDDYLAYRRYASHFAFDYFTTHQAKLKELTKQAFLHDFEISEMLLDEFLNYAQDSEIAGIGEPSERIKNELKKIIKARISKHLFQNELFYQIYNQDDEMIMRALESLKNPEEIIR